MSFKLENVIPWGRSSVEYQGMFNLSLPDLQGFILDCAGGPSSFNQEMTTQGYRVVSCDPIYQFSAQEIEQRIEECAPIILAGLYQTCDRFNWEQYASPEAMLKIRLAAMNAFIKDFPLGKQQGRYILAELPQLPFKDQEFSLALCSHLLFCYSDSFSLAFHINSILELARVAQEVRLFPLVENFTAKTSPHLQGVCDTLTTKGYQWSIETVSYHFQKNGNQMLVIKA